MSKVIRPLVKWKKLNPELYNTIYLPMLDLESIKAKENDFYFFYCVMQLNTDFKIKQTNDKFYFTPGGNHTNKGTVSEIGRLLLYGWYYNIENWTNEIGISIYNSYKEIEKSGKPFNNLDFKKAVKHIRDNIIYYYSNSSELNLYLTTIKNTLQK